MDTLQLKQLAALVRTCLEQSSISVTHSQALDAVASLVGLRNWPEVQAFPSRVGTTELDLTAASRLTYRLEKKYGYRTRPQEMLAALQPAQKNALAVVPQIWPAGPAPGVYLTTELDAIKALVARYEEATDGALLYTENVGVDFDGSIDLGEHGLWSNGLARVPSGTLIVVGPIELDQQSWHNAGERIEMACLTAVNSGHRVAILLDTPASENLAADVAFLAREPSQDDLDMAIVGWISNNGEMIAGEIHREWRPPVHVEAVASTVSLPPDVISLLEHALKGRTSGILAFGSAIITENSGSELLEAALALTNHLGPVARIMSRHRSTMSKFDEVPYAVAKLPFLPSVESAYAQGYRRFVIDPNYTRGDTFVRHQGNSLFLSSCYAPDVEGIVMSLARNHSHSTWPDFLDNLLAAVAVTPLALPSGKAELCDVYVKTTAPSTMGIVGDAVLDFPVENRVIRSEEQLSAWLRDGLDESLLEIAGLSKRTQKRIHERITGSR